MKLDLIYKKFKEAIKNADVEGICNCIIEGLKIREQLIEKKSSDFPKKLSEILQHGDTLVYQTLKMLEIGDKDRAAYYMQEVLKPMETIPKGFFFLNYVLGRIYYLNKDFDSAEKCFEQYNQLRWEFWQDADELSFFYQGNCAAMQMKIPEAIKFYTAALNIKSNFPEAKVNLETLKSGGGELAGELSTLWQPCDYRDIPIFINARDRLNTMKKLIDWLLDAEYRNLIILDNNSTYPKLLDYYNELEKDSRIKIILLGKNLGHKALWKSNILEKLNISTPYVYTDPDVVPAENCPKDFVKTLYEVLNAHHEIRKVAPALVWEDITFFDKEKWQTNEKDLCNGAYIGNNLCFSNVDTTFALYSNTRNYTLRFSLRTLGDMRIKHLPWYFDYDNLPEDEKYYMDHAEKNFITTVKK